jgi:hypothetical protein
MDSLTRQAQPCALSPDDTSFFLHVHLRTTINDESWAPSTPPSRFLNRRLPFSVGSAVPRSVEEVLRENKIFARKICTLRSKSYTSLKESNFSLPMSLSVRSQSYTSIIVHIVHFSQIVSHIIYFSHLTFCRSS